jgi:hypothetical protein
MVKLTAGIFFFKGNVEVYSSSSQRIILQHFALCVYQVVKLKFPRENCRQSLKRGGRSRTHAWKITKFYISHLLIFPGFSCCQENGSPDFKATPPPPLNRPLLRFGRNLRKSGILSGGFLDKTTIQNLMVTCKLSRPLAPRWEDCFRISLSPSYARTTASEP